MLVALSTAARLLIPRNKLRKSFFVQNVDASLVVYLKRERAQTPTVSSTSYDYRLGPGSGIAINSFLDGSEAIQDSYTAIADSGTPSVSWTETEDVVR
jgi:hypothetical protein